MLLKELNHNEVLLFIIKIKSGSVIRPVFSSPFIPANLCTSGSHLGGGAILLVAVSCAHRQIL